MLPSLTKMTGISLTKMAGEEHAEEETDMNGDGVLTTRQEQSLSLLTASGVTQSVARDLAKDCDPETVEGWIDYAEHADGLHSPVAFVVSKLKAGEPVPEIPDDGADPRSAEYRKRYLEWAIS